MLMKGPVRELYPTGPLQVSLRLPAGKQARSAQRLVNHGALAIAESAGTLSFTLESVLDHEVIAIDF